MRTLLFPCILLLIIYFFHGCTTCSCKKVPCGAFEDVSFQNWFDYQPEQKIIFKYQAAYDTITLENFYKSEAYEASQGCYNADEGCNQYVSIGSKEVAANLRQKLALTSNSVIPFGSSDTTKSISLFVQGFSCTASDINDQGLVVQPGIYSTVFSPTLTINGVVYNNVQTILRDTLADLPTQQPYKVYLSKGAGLIAYEIFPTHELWVKQ